MFVKNLYKIDLKCSLPIANALVIPAVSALIDGQVFWTTNTCTVIK